ncbi:terpenoid synthase [Aaosphaeria arxii CBS 175.79]|uniref:Terpene synthase n=1 Tax=Aaosphaeria arxii CBS 175.79 TaxID=1450172 RepID=A0A6A5X7D3_9PLEO|nr:terpenoid synthase [Aaosphaeria arxii CBS 175.79]KAF2008694.1 terpenoid synthase [Aaosphaeria arxii CBS 175.79]
MAQLSFAKDALSTSTDYAACNPVLGQVSSELENQFHRRKLLASLRGQTIRVPDLKPLFSHWPTKTNDGIDQMRQDIHKWLDSTVAPGNMLAGLQASDFGLFGATWWPCAPFERLRIVTYLAVWLFTWDDEIDLSDGTMWNEFGAAQSYREQTIAYVRYSLGIDVDKPSIENRIILNFDPIGAAVRGRYTLEQRHMFLKEMEFFMEMSEREQILRLSGGIASMEEFWEYRLGSSAVTVCLALNEFSWDGMDLPLQFYADGDVRALFRHTNTIISAVNDLLSIKKEIKRDAIDSLIPIIYFRTNDIQTAVQQVVAFIENEIKDFDAAAASLIRKYLDAEPAIQNHVHKFIDGCKYYSTGNLTWSLETDRYGVDHVEDRSGDIVMIL